MSQLHDDEQTKIMKVTLSHYKEMIEKLQGENALLSERIKRYQDALKEYKAAQRFLHMSGDDISDYYPADFKFMDDEK